MYAQTSITWKLGQVQIEPRKEKGWTLNFADQKNKFSSNIQSWYEKRYD